MQADHVVVMLDISNAFNEPTLSYVAERIPEIYKFLYSSYNVDSALQFGEFIILSLVGPQQGDPMNGLLFCLGIHSILQSTSSPLTAGLFDDITLGGGGPNVSVATYIDLIKSKGSELGLILRR